MTRRMGALLLALSLLAAACGDDSGGAEVDATSTTTTTTATTTTGDVEETTTSSTTSVAPLTASDRGVTAETIDVGIMVPDAEQILTFGVDLGWGDVEGHWQVAIDALNESGGVFGRTVVPTFYAYLPVGSDFSDLGCVKLTQDDQVFMVFGFIRPMENALCFTELNDTPVIGTGDRLTAEIQERSAFPAISLASSPSSADAAMISALEQLGELDGRTIAIHGRDENRLDAMTSQLNGLGHEVETRTVLSAPETDSLALDTELDTIVSRWISDDVDLVLNVTTSVALLGALNRVGFGVDIVTTETDVTLDDRDGRGGTVDEFRRVRVVGAVGSSSLVDGGHEPSTECRDRWNAERPDEIAVTFPGEGELQNLGLVLQACAAVDIFAELAALAGPELTREGFAAALRSVEELDLAGQFAASLGPDKWDVPVLDVVTISGWNDEEGAFRVVGDPIELG